jgi:hypothetical protein
MILNSVLCNDDYHGGGAIEPSGDETPRGLKQLFEKMNSGQRT